MMRELMIPLGGLIIEICALIFVPIFVFRPCLRTMQKTFRESQSILWKMHMVAIILVATWAAKHFFGGGWFNVLFGAMLISVAVEMVFASKGIFVLTLGTTNILLFWWAHRLPNCESLITAINVCLLCIAPVFVLLVWLLTPKSERLLVPRRLGGNEYDEYPS